MKLRATIAAAVTACLVALVAAPIGTTAAAAAAAPTPAAGITQTIDAITTAGTLNGVLQITQFAVQNGQIVALGTFQGTLTTAAGAVLPISQAVTLPLAAATGSCPILHLELGPLDLNVLGLVVHLDRVVLDITAQSGPGNLLGNLLCAVAHLLDGNAALTALVNQLNHILQTL